LELSTAVAAAGWHLIRPGLAAGGHAGR
jgi:hypothetical protein